ncbi:zinc finger protein, putative [Plasmodium ovale curtisi]|uniref:Zinc finger protein, putative n=1 Tax=Plasmodium ovale curtisi TaxID=864141 RepID=A0A1A8VZ94_PLAOA|nr:zinc finger protein, putative [Plasmodium ovale curtisi]SBS93287.1 zinc finger protein, putative [Plasmodium ovale curtisi]
MAYFSDFIKKCELEGCRNHDFLPFKCEYCGMSFCELHKKAQDHACSMLAQIDIKKVVLCEQCNVALPDVLNDINTYICRECKKNFCLPHRYCFSHNCPKEIREKTFLQTNGENKASKLDSNSHGKKKVT